MIEVLSSPLGQPYFTTVDGVQPHNHPYTTPICRMKYSSSVFNLQNDGIPTTWYTEGEDGDWVENLSGYTPNIKFYYGDGVPEAITSYVPGRKWNITYSGKFYPPYNGDYTFYLGGEGKTSFFVYGIFAKRPDNFSIDDKEYVEIGPYTLSSTYGGYYISLSYSSRNSDRNAGLVAMWQTDSASLTPEKILLSGSVFKKTTPEDTDFCDLSNYSNVSYKENENGQSELSFELPFVSTSAYNYSGYRYKATSKSYVDISSEQEIRKYRTIQYQEGYQSDSGDDELITRFTGQIRDIKKTYGKSDKIKIVCNDFSIFAKDGLNKMSPTPVDYWQAGYLTETPGRANGDTKPRAFDGWDVHKAYMSLLTDCGIDAFSFYKKKKYMASDCTMTEASYLIEPIAVSTVDGFPFLQVSENYGIDPISEVDSKPDDEYSYKINTGEYYLDSIDKILKSWYYKWGFNGEGYPYLKRINAPYVFLNDDSFATADAGVYWHEGLQPHAFRGTYIYATPDSIGQVASCDVTGKKFALLVGAGPLCGDPANSTSTFTVTVRNSFDEIVVSTSINPYNSTAHYYYDGARQTDAVNPSEVKIVNNVPFDTYRVVITPCSEDYYTVIEGILAYDEESEVPFETFYTDKNIVKLEINDSTDDQRTDCIVLGRRTGSIYREVDGEEEAVNKNNPTDTYIQSATRDLKSVYVSTANNYVGHSRETIIIDPSITSQNQADFISYNVVAEYHDINQNPSFSMQGNPKIEVGDCIAVSDEFKKGISSDDYLWVIGIENSFNKTFTTNVKTTPVKPVNSYWPRPEPDLSRYDNHYIWNLKVKYGGYRTYLTENLDCSSAINYMHVAKNDNFTDAEAYEAIPNIGYCRIGQEIIKYSSVSVNASDITLKDLVRNIPDGGDGAGHYEPSAYNDYVPSVVQEVIMGFNPYSTDSWVPTVEFDLLVDANVDISIKNFIGKKTNRILESGINEIKIDSLTNISDPTQFEDYIFLTAGHYGFTWSGFDRFGEYNEELRDLIDEPSLLKSQLYAREAYKCEYRNSLSGSKLTCDSGYGLFHSYVNVSPKNDPKVVKSYFTTDSATYNSVDSKNNDVGVINTILIDPGLVDLKFSTSGMYYANMDYFQVGYGSNKLRQRSGWSLQREDRQAKTFVVGTEIIQATNYPIIDDGDQYPFAFITNESNPNDYSMSQGLLFTVTTYPTIGATDADESIKREYFPNLDFYFVQIGWHTNKQNITWFEPIITSGTLGEEESISMISPGKQLSINLRRWLSKKDITFIPSGDDENNWKETFVSTYDADDTDAMMGITNLLYFGNNLYDLSGRRPRQIRTYTERSEPETDIGNFYVFYTSGGYYHPLSMYDTMFYYRKQQNYTQENDYTAPPFYFSSGYPTMVNDLRHPRVYQDLGVDVRNSNRGFYEFVNKDERLSWHWRFRVKYGVGGTEVVDRIFIKCIENEMFYRDCIRFRNNYITWMDDQKVREIMEFRDFEASIPYGVNVWALYRISDFVSEG